MVSNLYYLLLILMLNMPTSLIDLNAITEPIVVAQMILTISKPSEVVAGDPVQEVFIGSV
jgi:aconitase B